MDAFFFPKVVVEVVDEKWTLKLEVVKHCQLKSVNEKSPFNRNNLGFSQYLILTINSYKNY